MKIVAIADTHTFESDLPSVPLGDVLVHAGDLCRGGTIDELESSIAWLAGLPHAHKLIVAGNHDWCFQRDRNAATALLTPEMTYLEDSGVTIAGVRFWGSPWQPEFYDWAFNLRRGAALAAKWALIPDDADVLITHGPPRGYGDMVPSSGRQGCDELLSAVDRVAPLLHFFGHIHEDGGAWKRGETLLVNATTAECERAASVVDVDVEPRKAVAEHIPPREA